MILLCLFPPGKGSGLRPHPKPDWYQHSMRKRSAPKIMRNDGLHLGEKSPNPSIWITDRAV
jgi:hypothetical protein